MPLKLMYITNNPDVAMIAQDSGVDRIFIDMEYIGKDIRQKGLDSVKNHHTTEDIRRIKTVLNQSKLLVRINPIHEFSQQEIEATIDAGADIIMLPYFTSIKEVERFIELVKGRAKTMLLLETKEAAELIEQIVQISGIDEIHIGLNDLGISLRKTFMFESLSDGTVEKLCKEIKKANIPYGFGGIASLGKGMLPAERIIKEHYRLGSSFVILSRSFCNTSIITDLKEVKEIFDKGIKQIRELEKECASYEVDSDYFIGNQKLVTQSVEKIVKGMR